MHTWSGKRDEGENNTETRTLAETLSCKCCMNTQVTFSSV